MTELKKKKTVLKNEVNMYKSNYKSVYSVRYRALKFISFQYLILIQVPRAFSEIC